MASAGQANGAACLSLHPAWGKARGSRRWGRLRPGHTVRKPGLTCLGRPLWDTLVAPRMGRATLAVSARAPGLTSTPAALTLPGDSGPARAG